MMSVKRNFKDCPVPSYFSSEDSAIKKLINCKFPAVFQKISARKIRQFGTKTEIIFNKNINVEYFGQDILDIPSVLH